MGTLRADQRDVGTCVRAKCRFCALEEHVIHHLLDNRSKGGGPGADKRLEMVVKPGAKGKA